MNAEELLRQYEKVADAPTAIARLRRFILDLAVRGKLVPQDAGDAPVSTLLDEIDAKRAALDASTRATIDRSQVDVSDVPFELPRTWAWTRLGRLTSYIQRGKSPKYADSEGSPVVSQKCVQWSGLDLSAARMVTMESLADYDEVRFLRDGDLLWNSTGTGTIGRVIRLIQPPIRLVCDSHVTVVRCLGVVPEYVRTWLRSDHVYGSIEGRAAGSTNQVELTGQMAISQLVPLPPLAEQHRIVAKVDELMALCDRLEAARAERESRRTGFSAATLGRLMRGESGGECSQLATQHLDRLAHRCDQVEMIRQTILGLAVRGRLVPQVPGEIPVSSVLEKLTVPGPTKLRRGVPADVSVPEAVHAWPIPPSWERWSAASMLEQGVLVDLKDGNHGANHPKVSDFSDDGLPFITAAQVIDRQLKFDTAYRLSGPPLDKLRVGFAKTNDVIYTHKGSVGRVAVAHADCILSPQTTYYRPNPLVLDAAYLAWFLSSDLFSDQVDEVKRQTTRDFVAISKQYTFFHALPPLREQRRIAAKLLQVMALLDELERGLAAADQQRRLLLEALLHQALEPAEAAEGVA